MITSATNFNIVFGQEPIKALMHNIFLPEEHFIQKGNTMEDFSFHMMIMFNLSRQACHTIGVLSIDASSFNNGVNHIMYF